MTVILHTIAATIWILAILFYGAAVSGETRNAKKSGLAISAFLSIVAFTLQVLA